MFIITYYKFFNSNLIHFIFYNFIFKTFKIFKFVNKLFSVRLNKVMETIELNDDRTIELNKQSNNNSNNQPSGLRPVQNSENSEHLEDIRLRSRRPTLEKPMTELERRKQKIFEDNEIGDLKRFLSRRKCLNRCNMSMAYVFHMFQIAGIFTTSLATGMGMHDLVWLGVGLNSLASLISMFEKTNDGIMKRMLNNIKKIKEGRYVDESNVVDLEQGANSLPPSPPQK